MNLKPEQVAELNRLLATEKLDLPPFRKEVGSTGSNYVWLQKNLTKRNQNASPQLKALLGIT